MNHLTELFQIDGKALMAPDENLAMSFEDIDGADAGRDESGVMHRVLLRRKVGKWSFQYTHLTGREFAYMVSVLPQAGEFVFTYPDPLTGEKVTCLAYLSGYSVSYHNAVSGAYRDLKFNIIEC